MITLLARPEATTDQHSAQALFSRTLRLLNNNILNYHVLPIPRHRGEAFARAHLLTAMLEPGAHLDTLELSAALLRDENYALLTPPNRFGPAVMTMDQCDALAEYFMNRYWESKQLHATAPDRIQASDELEAEAVFPIFAELALQMAYGPRVMNAHRIFVLRTRMDKLLEEGATNHRSIFKEAFSDAIWAP